MPIYVLLAVVSLRQHVTWNYLKNAKTILVRMKNRLSQPVGEIAGLLIKLNKSNRKGGNSFLTLTGVE